MLVFKQRRKNPTLEETLTPSQRRLQRTLLNAWAKIQKDVNENRQEIADTVMHRPASVVLQHFDRNPLIDAAEDSLVDELLGELRDGGSRVTLPAIEKAKFRFSFDRSDPRTVSWARTNAGRLITNLWGSQEDTVRSLVARASSGQLTVGSVARSLQSFIGLTEQQYGWVDNHYNRTFERLVRDGFSVADAEALADQANGRYYQQVLRYRSETIARTEILSAAHQGRVLAWEQGIEGGYIDPSWQQQWIASYDACDSCSPLDGMKIPLRDTWPLGGPPAHPNCRCDVQLVPPAVDGDLAALTDAELDSTIQSLVAG